MIATIKSELERTKEQKAASVKKEEDAKNSLAKVNEIAYQELYELTLRKFWKRLKGLSERMHPSKAYPNLLVVDFIDPTKYEKSWENRVQVWRPNLKLMNSVSSDSAADDSAGGKKSREENLKPCIRVLCEHEEGWHLAPSCILIDDIKKSYMSYLGRLVKILNDDILASELTLFSCESGKMLMSDLSDGGPAEFEDSYKSLKEDYIREVEENRVIILEALNSNEPINSSFQSKTSGSNVDLRESKKLNRIGLRRCELKTGRILWLCSNHIDKMSARILNDDFDSQQVEQDDQYRTKMLEDVDSINISLLI